MRKASLLLVAAIMVLAVMPFAAASAMPDATLNVVFDGYCDGLSLQSPSLGLTALESVDGDQTGCVTGGVFGTASAFKGESFVTVPGYGTLTVVGRNQKWIHYALNGNLIYILNQGTWSPGQPFGGPVSGQAGTARAAATGSPDNVINITLDGYCDGFQLNNPSIGLGTPGTIDGNRTGCVTDPVMGATTRLRSDGAMVVTFFADGAQWLQTVIMLDGRWIHFALSGDTIYILNSGTWSYGTSPHGTRSSTA